METNSSETSSNTTHLKSNRFLYPVHFLISRMMAETHEANSEPIKSLWSASYEDSRTPNVGFGNPSVPLHHNNFGPYVIFNRFPFSVDFPYMILSKKKLQIWFTKSKELYHEKFIDANPNVLLLFECRAGQTGLKVC